MIYIGLLCFVDRALSGEKTGQQTIPVADRLIHYA